MKYVWSFAICLLLAGGAHAENTVGLADLNGEKIILLPDFTWRYDDSGGERCTTVRKISTVCALPSVWSPVPGDPGFDPRWFQQGSDLKGRVVILDTNLNSDPITIDKVMRFINADRQKDTNFGLKVVDTKSTIAGVKLTTVVSVIGTTSTRAYSFAFLPKGTAILVTTVEDPSFQYTYAHTTAHKSFVDAIRIEGKQ